MSSAQVGYELSPLEQLTDGSTVGFTSLSLFLIKPILRTPHSVDSLVDHISPLLFFKDTHYVLVTGRDEPRSHSYSPSLYTFEGYGTYKGVRQWTALFDGNTFYLSLERDCFIQTTTKQLERLIDSLAELLCTNHSTDISSPSLN